MAKQFSAPAAYCDEPCPDIPMEQVVSKQVACIGYDPSTQVLAVQFTRGTGAIYHYPNVSPEAYQAFRQAESIGAHFGQHIKQLPFKKYRAPTGDEKEVQPE